MEADDEETFNEAVAELDQLMSKLDQLEFRRMFSGEYDSADCYLDIQAGSGGTEAQDWASMLLRMYLRWAEAKGFKTEVIEESDGDVAGLKSATIKIIGDYAFGWLRTETGVHRLVRKSPFDSGGRRHSALLEVANRDARQLAANDLGFALGPRLNAAGRLDDMSIGVALLLSDDIAQARMLANDLDALNQTRREIEQGMQVEALQLCDQLERTSTELPYGLAMYHPEWHQGVVGILASRIKERFHRPVIAFAPAGDGILKGSGRSVPGLHMRDALERLDMLNPGLMMKFGGHAMAAGLSLEEAKFDEFRQRFGELVGEWLDPAMLEGVIWSDGELAMQELSLTTAELLREGGPWGQAFPEPTFDGKFRILQQRLVGEKHLKLMVEPLGGGPLLDGIAFNVDTTLWPDSSVREVELAYKLDVNEFRGNRNVQLLIQHLWPR